MGARTAGAPYVVRVWDSEGGALHAVGEAAPGLLAPLAWQPNGRHLYAAAAPVPAAQRSAPAGPAAQGRAQGGGGRPTQGKVAAATGGAQGRSAGAERRAPASGAARVLLFERNGLRHGGFDLPSPGARRHQACGHGARGHDTAILHGAKSSASHQHLLDSKVLAWRGGAEHVVALTCASRPAGEVTGLHWSPGSELLAVVLRAGDPAAGPPPSHTACAAASGSAAGQAHGAGPRVGGAGAARPRHMAVQIWLRSNWHWYLKQARPWLRCLICLCAMQAAQRMLRLHRQGHALCTLAAMGFTLRAQSRTYRPTPYCIT